MDWIDEFEGVEFLMKDDRAETRSAGQAPVRNIRTESMDERLNRFMMDFSMDDDPLDMAMDDLNVVAQPKQRHTSASEPATVPDCPVPNHDAVRVWLRHCDKRPPTGTEPRIPRFNLGVTCPTVRAWLQGFAGDRKDSVSAAG
eukprot:684222-Hanusia_phi.AAC.2